MYLFARLPHCGEKVLNAGDHPRGGGDDRTAPTPHTGAEARREDDVSGLLTIISM